MSSSTSKEIDEFMLSAVETHGESPSDEVTMELLETVANIEIKYKCFCGLKKILDRGYCDCKGRHIIVH